jgi:hypothetical protein
MFFSALEQQPNHTISRFFNAIHNHSVWLSWRLSHHHTPHSNSNSTPNYIELKHIICPIEMQVQVRLKLALLAGMTMAFNIHINNSSTDSQTFHKLSCNLTWTIILQLTKLSYLPCNTHKQFSTPKVSIFLSCNIHRNNSSTHKAFIFVVQQLHKQFFNSQSFHICRATHSHKHIFISQFFSSQRLHIYYVTIT